MTVPIEYAPVPASRVVAGLSRYAERIPIYYGEQKILTFDTYLRKPYKKTGKEKVMVVTKGVEYRPDLVSFDVYGTVDLWWKILETNGIHDIFDFKAGLTIFLPEELF